MQNKDTVVYMTMTGSVDCEQSPYFARKLCGFTQTLFNFRIQVQLSQVAAPFVL